MHESGEASFIPETTARVMKTFPALHKSPARIPGPNDITTAYACACAQDKTHTKRERGK